MNRPARRIGTVVLGICLIPGLLSTTQAGLIPWLYDAVFGPVAPYGYGYHSSYAYPYVARPVITSYRGAPSTCGPVAYSIPAWTSGYGNGSYGPSVTRVPSGCSTGSCPPIVGCYRPVWSPVCGPCQSGTCRVASAAEGCKSNCDAKGATTEWKAEVLRGNAASDVTAPEPATLDEAPRPRTFADEPADPFNSETTVEKAAVTEEAGASSGGGTPGDPNWDKTGESPVPVAVESAEKAVSETAPAAAEAVSKPVIESVVSPADATGLESAGFGEAVREADGLPDPEVFSTPLDKVKPEKSAPVDAPLLEGLDLNSSDEKVSPLDLQNQSSWKFRAPFQRISFRAGFRTAVIARQTVRVETDYVIPAAATAHLVSR